jgi:hypothetical protein
MLPARECRAAAEIANASTRQIALIGDRVRSISHRGSHTH